jgi:hypothetical protein
MTALHIARPHEAPTGATQVDGTKPIGLHPLDRALLQLFMEFDPPPGSWHRVTAGSLFVDLIVSRNGEAPQLPAALPRSNAGPIVLYSSCEACIWKLLNEEGPLLRREILVRLAERGTRYCASTVAEALARMTGSGALINPRNRTGYRPAEGVAVKCLSEAV